jgi:adenine-specific DNA-methyltransferase
MTLTDINKALSNLAEQPTRKNILAFSFELLHWMNIAPNADNKPQLLSPQTQKLKDYLANAPQTVQPQLYRLSADNQPIRVRFAVLKKLKKEYISQLVDNDPGLGSYQAMSKGLTIPATGTAFIPAQPYFIHFVTTPDYDKLVLIFNQGEQKRIVSFRNRLTNTQYHKIIQTWQGIGSKAKPEIADLLWKSLDIKEVNKEFYKQIKERFDALLGIVKTQHGNATENQIKQFTVRMIGRYIFCWFLKEKGIIPHSLISKQTIESTDKYYQTVLLKLFFETLNTKVQDRDPLKHNKLFEKIPYLNGGLFDESEEDKLFTKLNLDAWLLPFVEILESYDFTVDESSSQYQQVAVDPEMLGRIFENLLASQNEETEKLANQRKAFGAFYTPREIVDYMVNESIKAYLQTQWEQHLEAAKTKHINNPEPIVDIFGNKKPQQLTLEIKRYELKPEEKAKIEKALEPLFASNPDAGHLKKDEKTLLLGFLEQIKILDPACGSGAFPMGILHKLVELHEALGTVKSSYELKNDILSQNIYGVDIMPMAIEIARLRAWLSLVLEEDYKPSDPKHNFGVKPLPNLDFKFVCANSLIDLGLDAFIQESKGTLHEGFTQKLVKELKDLETLRTNFFNPTLASNQKEQLKTDYFEKRDKVIFDIEAAHDPILKQIAQKIKHWNPFDDSQPSLFFSPTWMFGIDKGFDVVIGNPPYVQMQKGIYSSITFPYSEGKDKGKQNLYKVFVEASYNNLKPNGTASMIVQSSLMCDLSSTFTRELLLTKTELEKVLEYPKSASNTEAQVFDSVLQGTCTYLFSKKTPGKEHSVSISIQNDTSTIANPKFEKFNQLSLIQLYPDTNYIPLISEGDSKVLRKISTNSIPFKNLILSINQGDLNLTSSSKEFSDTKTDVKLYRGRNIHKYQLLETVEEYVKNTFRKDKVKENQEHTFIVLQEITGTTDKYRLHACLTDKSEKFLFGHTANKILLKDDSLNKTCLALLNSKLQDWFFRKTSTNNHVMGYEIKQLPFPKDLSQNQIEKLVDEILKKKKANQDTTSLEKEIDVLVYKLYDLTYDEVKIIDKDFWLSEEEYGKIKLG